MSVEGIFKGITRAKKEGNSIEGTGGHKEGKTRNCNLPKYLKNRIFISDQSLHTD